VTLRAADAREDLLSAAYLICRALARDGSQKLHEAREVVDAAPTRPWVANVFGVGKRIAQPHLFGRHGERAFVRKDVVGNPHLVAIRVCAKRDQRGVLRLPTESADTSLTAFDVGDDGGPAAHTVAVAIERVFERKQRVVGNGFHQPRAEQRNRHPPREYSRIDRQHRLTPMTRNGKHMKERVPGSVERLELPVRIPPAGSQLGHRPGAADCRNVVADRAARSVESGTQTFFAGLDLEEVVEPEAKLLKLDWRDARERCA
jgi:hypothetical protein